MNTKKITIVLCKSDIGF